MEEGRDRVRSFKLVLLIKEVGWGSPTHGRQVDRLFFVIADRTGP